MKLVWCPETASKAYIDTVKVLTRGGNTCSPEDSNGAELLSAMAGGWKARCIVEAWEPTSEVSTSVGLATAARYTGGRHVCVVPDERSGEEYKEAMWEAGEGVVEVVVGEAEEALGGISDVDFVVMDCRRGDLAQFLRHAKLEPKGAVLVWKGAGSSSSSNLSPAGGPSWFWWRGALTENIRVVRSAFLPVGRGLEIVHVRVENGPGMGSNSRWIKYVDCDSKEEHAFRC